MALALWMSEAISWLREVTSLRSSWFSRRRLDSSWLRDSSGNRGSGRPESWGADSPESEPSGVSGSEEGRRVEGGKGSEYIRVYKYVDFGGGGGR